MPVTPDPETTWGLAFAGGFSNPGIKIDLSGLIGKFEYNGAVFKYESTIGVKRDVEINPASLFGMIGPNKIVSGIASFVGNYEIQVSEFTNIVLGNQLNLERSKVSYNANREYSITIKVTVVASLVIMALADIAVVYSLGYGLKENDSAAKTFVGVQQGVYSAALIVLHYLETLGVESKALLLDLTGQLKTVLDTLTTLVGNNSNVADLLNPLLAPGRIINIKTVAQTALTNANDKITSVSTAITAAAGQAPIPCWVARAVYGPENPRWIIFRRWLFGSGPVPETRTPLQRLYMRHGEKFAQMVDKSSCLRCTLRMMMDLILWLDQKNQLGSRPWPMYISKLTKFFH